MSLNLRVVYKSVIIVLVVSRLNANAQSNLNATQKDISYCTSQIIKTLKLIPPADKNIPRSIYPETTNWLFTDYNDWCSGFWPGILWYAYEATGNSVFKTEADIFSLKLQPLLQRPATDHDLGFQLFNSMGNGHRLTGLPAYKQFVLAAADSLATLYNPKVGTILSWPAMVKKQGWQHNTIIDNMINLELLFWAAKHGGSQKLYDIAVKHAETTMKNHFRANFSAYHVVVYDTITGVKIKGLTHQGYADNSMWARGQSWAIYGFTMCYRETKKVDFLDVAQKAADVYLSKLPIDLVPYWDFNDPAIPDAPKDASAAAVTASALLELSTFVKNKDKSRLYRIQAERMLTILSSAKYQNRKANSAFLLHSTGHKPNGTEVNTSIIYADYYYLEGLLRLAKLQQHQSIYSLFKSSVRQ